jgi:hypothetical protein
MRPMATRTSAMAMAVPADTSHSANARPAKTPSTKVTTTMTTVERFTTPSLSPRLQYLKSTRALKRAGVIGLRAGEGSGG